MYARMFSGNRLCFAALIAGYFAINVRAELLLYDPFLIGGPPAEYVLGQLVGQNPLIGPAFPPFLDGPWTSRPIEPSLGHVVQAGSDYKLGVPVPRWICECEHHPRRRSCGTTS